MKAGVDKILLRSIIKDGIITEHKTDNQDNTKAIKKIKIKEPRSRIQEIFKDLYDEMVNVESPDHFDCYYEDKKLGEYKNIKQVVDKLYSFTTELKLNVELTGEPYKDFTSIMFYISERINEERVDTLSLIKNKINSEFSDLINNDADNVSEYEKNESQFKSHVNDRLDEIMDKIETDGKMQKEYKKELQAIEDAQETDLSTIAYSLNQFIIIGETNWKTLLLSALSTYAPKIEINGEVQRNNIHTLLEGDISTAKSTIIRKIAEIMPKSKKTDKVTEATMEGVATNDGIEEGVIDIANDGLLLCPEYDRIKEMSITRTLMDCDTLDIDKKGFTKTVNINMTWLAGANPKDDFFNNKTPFRDQITFKEGVLSRFDVLIPLQNTVEQSNSLIDDMVFFGKPKTKLSMEKIRSIIKVMCLKMQELKDNKLAVKITAEHNKTIRETFKNNNRQLELRPLLILRDVETLCRLINVITYTNYSNRKRDKKFIYATNEDVEEAIAIFEHIIQLRCELYESRSKFIKDTEMKIIEVVSKDFDGTAKASEICDIVISRNVCSKATFYRKIETMHRNRKIQLIGAGNREIRIIGR